MTGKATILVVEDEVLVRHAVIEFLRDYDFHVLGAANGDEAVTVLSAGVAVDVVFSDVVMPGRLNGFALAQWIASNWPKVRVLLTSGYAGMEQRASDLAADVRVLDKPYRLSGPVAAHQQSGRAVRPRLRQSAVRMDQSR